MSQLKLTLKRGGKESTVSGYALCGSSPMVFPPIYSLNFKNGNDINGDLWDQDRFEVDSCTAELNDQTYFIPRSTINLMKDDDGEFNLQVNIQTHDPPQGETLPFIN